MNRFILTLFACSSILLEANPGDLEELRPKIHDEKRYEDLLDDPFNKRFLSVMLDIRSYAGDGGYAVYNLHEFAWCREQGVKALPLMLEVLKREPTPNVGDSGEIWFSLRYKSAALIWTRDFPTGDSQPFLEEVRRQLPGWLERQIANNDSHTGFIRDALELLEREGDESDIPLLESFLNDVNGMNKESAQKSLTKLNERLASEATETSRVQRGLKSDISREKTTSLFNEANNSEEKIADEKKYHQPSIIAFALLVGILAFLLKIYKLKFKP